MASAAVSDDRRSSWPAMSALELMWLPIKWYETDGRERYKRNPGEAKVSQGLISYSTNGKVMGERLIQDFGCGG